MNWQDNFDSDQEDPSEIIRNEEEEFDLYFNELQEDYEQFVSNAPHFTFDLLTINVYDKLISGEYIPKKEYDIPKEKDEFIAPEPIFWYPENKTEQEKIEEKKGWVKFVYQYPPCKECRRCKKGRRCRNRGRKVETPVYPELFIEKEETPIGPPPKTIMEKVIVEKKKEAKQLGNTWAIKSTTPKSLNIEDIQKNAIRKEIEKKEEEECRIKEEKERKKREEELQRKREQARIEREERRRRQRGQQQERRNKWRTNLQKRNGGGSNRFRNMFG